MSELLVFKWPPISDLLPYCLLVFPEKSSLASYFPIFCYFFLPNSYLLCLAADRCCHLSCCLPDGDRHFLQGKRPLCDIAHFLHAENAPILCSKMFPLGSAGLWGWHCWVGCLPHHACCPYSHRSPGLSQVCCSCWSQNPVPLLSLQTWWRLHPLLPLHPRLLRLWSPLLPSINITENK